MTSSLEDVFPHQLEFKDATGEEPLLKTYESWYCFAQRTTSDGRINKS